MKVFFKLSNGRCLFIPGAGLRFYFVVVCLLGVVCTKASEHLTATNNVTAPTQSLSEIETHLKQVVEQAAPKTNANQPTLLNLTSAADALSATNVPASPQTNSASAISSNPKNADKPAAIKTMDDLDDKHKLAIGDKLSFRIEEDQEEPKPLIVTDSGDLEFPYIGRVSAENKTCKQLAREIKADLEKEYYYQATVLLAVDLMTKSRGKVYLVGPVRSPGPQEIPSDEVLTLSKAIMRAGGFGDYADKKRVQVNRSAGSANKQTFLVDLEQVLEKGRMEKDLPLEPGDLVVIPERLIRF